MHQQVIRNISATPIVSIIHKFRTCSGTDFFSSLAANIQRAPKHSITLSPPEKSHQLCFFVISEILFLHQMPAVCLKPRGTLTQEHRQAGALPKATPAGKCVTGKLTQLSPNSCVSNVKPWYLDTVFYLRFVGYVFLHTKSIRTSFRQASQASGASVVS